MLPGGPPITLFTAAPPSGSESEQNGKRVDDNKRREMSDRALQIH